MWQNKARQWMFSQVGFRTLQARWVYYTILEYLSCIVFYMISNESGVIAEVSEL